MNGSVRVASCVTLLACAGMSAIAVEANASELIGAEVKFTQQELQSLARSSSGLAFNTALFLYGADAEAFDLAGYLAVHAPRLRHRQELIAHWSGYYSINPKVVLALMELKTGLISAPSKAKLQVPFGDMSKARGFEGQLRDVLQQLSQRFYGFESHQRQQTGAAGKRLGPDLGSLNGATAALLAGLQQADGEGAALRQEQSLQGFTQTFSQLFNMAPEQLLAVEASEQRAVAASQLPPLNMLQLPWYQGYSWRSNGAHSHTGSGSPYSSIDLSYDWPGWGAPTYSVVAAHGGRVSVLSRCQVRVTHANSWSTNYYHMDGIRVSHGETIAGNTKLGVYASNRNTALCEGGSSTGPHLHFSLLYNGRYMSLQGVNLSVFRISVGAYNYDNQCNRFNFYNLNNGAYQCAWSPLYNAGPMN